jgi:hypothetical protein
MHPWPVQISQQGKLTSPQIATKLLRMGFDPGAQPGSGKFRCGQSLGMI